MNDLIDALRIGMSCQDQESERKSSASLMLITRALSAACSIVPESDGRAMIELRNALEGFNGICPDLPLRTGVVIKYGVAP